VTKLAADGSALIFSTYLGGTAGAVGAAESGLGIAVDGLGNVYVAGVTSSTDFPVRSAAQSANAGWLDGFAAKLSASGALVYSTYVGGLNTDMANAIAVDASGCAYIAGMTASANLASLVGSQGSATGIYDAFVVKLAAAGNSIAALLYLGGAGADNASAIAVDTAANVYIAGWTQSPNFAVVNGFQSINGGNYSAFVGKVNLGTEVTVGVLPSTATLSASQTQQFTASVGNTSNTAVTWSISPAGIGSVSGAGLYTAPAAIATQQIVTVTATSVADTSKKAAGAVTLTPNAPPPVAVRVNAGGTSYTDSLGQLWSADTGCLRGGLNSTTAAIAGTANAALYQTEHYSGTGTLTCQYAVPNGAYNVTLKFAEIWYTSAGQRLFDVALNGSSVRTRLDVFAAAGGANTAYDVTYPVTVTNGQVTLTLTAMAGLPMINAIEIASTTITPDFALTATPGTQTITQGSGAVYTAAVSIVGGFGSAVAVNLSGLPAGATATFNPPSLTGAGSTTMTVTTVSTTPAGSYTLTLTGTSGSLIHTATVQLVVSAAAVTAVRVNAGGSSYTDSLGQLWSADTGCLQVGLNSTTAAIAGTANAALYQTEHYSGTGTLTCQYPVPNGAYNVTLKFAEIWYTSAGQRLFDVALNGSTVRTRLDVFAAAGGANTAYDLTYPVTVTNGQVTLTLTAVTGSPKINAIEIR
jgi:hypothetical protein